MLVTLKRITKQYDGILILCGIGLFVLANVVGIVYAQSIKPQPQLVLPCSVVSVHDGDTLTATVTLKMNVRLLDCWAPELRDANGNRSKAKLTELANGKKGIITIPLGDDVGDSLTFGRVLGRVSIDGKDLSEQMVKGGYATKEKAK